MDYLPQDPERSQRKKIYILAAIGLLLLAFLLVNSEAGKNFLSRLQKKEVGKEITKKEFQEDFGSIDLNETGKMSGSSNPDWWLNSGGYLYSENAIGKTFQGEVPEDNIWYKKYQKANPEDTDEGSHPQNLFRLVTRNKWLNLRQQAYFRIVKDNLSESDNRNESNGLLLFNRYRDGDNLYYAGIRVDGAAVIKKKINGKYFTMAQKSVFDGKYDRDNNPDLLPKDKWLGIRSEVVTDSDGTVKVNLYLDEDQSGNWQLALSAVDDNKKYGGESIDSVGYGGIRTDFMDVEFDDYKIEKLE